APSSSSAPARPGRSGSPSTPGVPVPGRRHAVHAASGKRLGVAHPRQEGPPDLRLVPPALAASATAAATLDASPGTVAGLVVVCLGVAVALAVGRRRSGDGSRGRHSGWSRATAVAVLLCTATAAV